MSNNSGPPPISSLVAGMTTTEVLIYSELLCVQNLVADMLGAQLATLPEAASEAFKASRRTARLRLSPSFGPLNVECLEALNDCVQAAIGRTLDLASNQEAANRAMRAARAIQGAPEGSRAAPANDPST